MKRLVLIAFLLTFALSCISFSADEIKIEFSNKDRLPGHCISYLPLYKFDANQGTDIKYAGKSHNFILPDMKSCNDIAFAKEFFTGSKEKTDREIFFVIGNYSGDQTYIWVDKNNNFNFRDDGDPIILSKSHPNDFITLCNYSNPDAKFVYSVKKFDVTDSAIKARVKQFFYNSDTSKGYITTDMDYWLITERYNIIGRNAVINGDSVKIGINDWNCNGKYNDMDTVSADNFDSDRLCFGKLADTSLSAFTNDGAIVYLPNTVIQIGNKVYEVTGIEESGKFIKLKPSYKKFDRLSIGDKCPDLEFTLFNGDTTTLYKHLKPGKYNLIYIWATWCQGCVTTTLPKLKVIDSLYKDKINIVGLHHWQGCGESTGKWIKEQKFGWVNGIENPEIDKKLLVGGGAGYEVLLDKDLKIVKFGISTDEVKSILSESSKK